MKLRSLFLACALLITTTVVCGQDAGRKISPFWNRERKIETAVYIGAVAIDDYSTQLDRRRNSDFVEYNPTARPFYTRGPGYQALGASIGLAEAVLPSYLLHRLHHEKASRWWLRIAAGGEAVSASRMLYLYH
jgi:hypothetical protein